MSKSRKAKSPHEKYLRFLELFAALHEEVGEAQKAFNDLMWNNGRISSQPIEGNPNHRDNFITNVNLSLELEDIQIVLDEMKERVFEVMACPVNGDEG